MEERAAHLLYLIHQKGQHHQCDKDAAQMFFAQSVIMIKVISLILERIDGLVFNPPSSPAAAHDLLGILLGDFYVRYPTESLADSWLVLPFLVKDYFFIFKKVDQ